MAEDLFEKSQRELDDALAFLRSFTLGKRGFTQRDGAAGMQRVRDTSARLEEDFAAGPNGTEVTTAVSTARSCLKAAQARLDLLKAKQ